jgi:hypothetical protein
MPSGCHAGMSVGSFCGGAEPQKQIGYCEIWRMVKGKNFQLLKENLANISMKKLNFLCTKKYTLQ